jgi:hypothetical protein
MTWQDRLLAEKSLLEVFSGGRRLLGASYHKWLILVICLALAFAMAIAWPSDPAQSGNLLTMTIAWAQAGLAFSTSILGFLLAGFAIFATLTKTELFEILAQIPYRDSGISHLKFVFFNFIVTFIQYLAFLSFCAAVTLLFATGSPVRESLSQLLEGWVNTKHALVASTAILLAGWFAAVLLMLKSFIWNLYQAVLFTIVADAELREREKRNRENQFD